MKGVSHHNSSADSVRWQGERKEDRGCEVCLRGIVVVAELQDVVQPNLLCQLVVVNRDSLLDTIALRMYGKQYHGTYEQLLQYLPFGILNRDNLCRPCSRLNS